MEFCILLNTSLLTLIYFSPYLLNVLIQSINYLPPPLLENDSRQKFKREYCVRFSILESVEDYMKENNFKKSVRKGAEKKNKTYTPNEILNLTSSIKYDTEKHGIPEFGQGEKTYSVNLVKGCRNACAYCSQCATQTMWGNTTRKQFLKPELNQNVANKTVQPFNGKIIFNSASEWSFAHLGKSRKNYLSSIARLGTKL